MTAVTEVLASEWLTTGPAVTEFERALSVVAGAPCVSVSSGTAALHTAYAAIGIEPGDEIITTPLTFIATQSTAVALGARIVFADVQADTGNLDPKAVEELITERTRAVVAVDYAGHPADLNELKAVTVRHGIALLEDAAHSIGSTYRGHPVGSVSDLTTFSFFPTKNLTTAEGGAVACQNSARLLRAQRFRTHGLVREREDQQMPDEGPWHQEVHEFGLNYRLPDVLAALGTSQLQRLNQFKERRTAVFDMYCNLLAGVDELVLPAWRDYVDPMWHLYPLRVPPTIRREVFESLRARAIGVQVNYLPAYLHPVFADLGYARGLCPKAEEYYASEISLPMHAELTDSQVAYIAEGVLSAVASASGG